MRALPMWIQSLVKDRNTKIQTDKLTEAGGAIVVTITHSGVLLTSKIGVVRPGFHLAASILKWKIALYHAETKKRIINCSAKCALCIRYQYCGLCCLGKYNTCDLIQAFDYNQAPSVFTPFAQNVIDTLVSVCTEIYGEDWTGKVIKWAEEEKSTGDCIVIGSFMQYDERI